MEFRKCIEEKSECIEECDNGMKSWEIAIYEARTLAPSTRNGTLDWILRRIKKLQGNKNKKE